MKLKVATFIILVFMVGFVSKANLNAQSVKSSGLTRSDVVIDPSRPTIYLCIPEQTQNDDKSNIVARLFNNTIWTIKFPGEKQGDMTQLLKLSNGRKIMALKSGAISYPQYEIEYPNASKITPISQWGDVTTSIFLPSGSNTYFSVPSNKVSKGELYLEYKYEWEVIGTAGQESYAPIHRVYLARHDSGYKGRECAP